MRLSCVKIDSLPRLAWCASLTQGSDVVAVLHGPWVETGAGHYFEGAWDGDFGAARFDASETFVGTGGRLQGDKIIFASPTNLLDRIFSIRVGERLLVSNSLVFLLSRAGDEPDPAYPYYWQDYLEHRQQGLYRKVKTIHTRRGNRVHFHDYTNIAVGADLRIDRLEKRLAGPPADYASYQRALDESLRGLFLNAGDPRRRQKFRPVATLSRGYDTTAIAALASRAGCTEGMTFVDSASDAVPDCGTEIGRLLGLEVTEYDREGYKKLGGFPEAEFCCCPFQTDVPFAVAERQLAGAIFLNGRLGDLIWGKERRKMFRKFKQPSAHSPGGTSMGEFRLRVGFLNHAPLYTAAEDPLALYRITMSDEMKPWSVGGPYDRPIARRIAEEAGVPRELFGTRKRAGAFQPLLRSGTMGAASEVDFARFCSSLTARASLWERGKFALFHRLFRWNQAANRAISRTCSLVSWPVRPPRLIHERYRRKTSVRLFTYHWGFHRIRSRYDVPVDGSTPVAVGAACRDASDDRR